MSETTVDHDKVESIEKDLLSRPHREVFYRGVPIECFSHDALVVIAGEFLRQGRFL